MTVLILNEFGSVEKRRENVNSLHELEKWLTKIGFFAKEKWSMEIVNY